MKIIYKFSIIVIALIFTLGAMSQTLTDNIGCSYQYLESQTTNPLGPQNTIADLTEKFWLSNDEGGAVPIDLYYHEATNRVFVYGKRNIAVYDASSGINSLIARLPLIYFNDGPKEEPSQFYPAIENTNYLNTNHFAFKPGGANPDILYCLGEAFNVYAIDPVNLTVDFKYRASVQCDQLGYKNAFLKYDSRLDWIYVIFSTISDGYVEINDVSNSYSEKGSLHFDYEIRSFEFNHNIDEFYLGLGSSFQIIVFDPTVVSVNNSNTTMSTIGEVYTASSAGNMLYLNEAGLHKLFCFPNGGSGNQNFFVKDLSDGGIDDFEKECPGGITAACFDGIDKIYLSYMSTPGNNDLRTISAISHLTIGADVNTRDGALNGNNYTLDMEMLDGQLILTKDSEVTLYNCNTSNPLVTQLNQGENNYFSRVVENNDKAYVIGTWSTELDIFSTGRQIDNSIELGGIVFKACHNPNENKIYFYNTHIQDNSKIYIFNTTDNSIDMLELNGSIADIEIHPLTNNALISSGDGTNTIKVVDGNTNLLLPENDWLELEPNHSNIGEMFVSPNNHLYCVIRENSSGNPGIEIRDISQSGNTLYAFIQYNTTNTISGVFTSSNSSQRAEDDYVYAAINNPNESSGILYKINDETYGSEDVPIPVNSFDIEKEGKFVYIAISSTTKKVLAIDDTTWPNPNITELVFDGTVKDIDVNETNGYLYVLHDYGVYESAISTISGTDVSNNKITALYSPASNIKYNNDNNCLYVFVHYVPNGCITDPGGIYEIFNEDMGEDGFVFYSNTDRQRDKNGMSYMPFPHDLVIDQSDHSIYYGGGGHSCINKLELVHTYKIKLRLSEDPELPGTLHTTWLSIPRHYHSIPANPPTIPTDAEHTPVVFTSNTIDADYSDLTLQYIQIQGVPGNYTELDENAHWTNNSSWVYNPQGVSDMDKTYSYRGYKLHLDPDWAGDNYLHLYGSIEDPNTSFDLKCREQNWIGYFIPEVQDVFDALGDNIDHIYMIQHQDFTCVKTPYPTIPCPGSQKSGNDIQPGSWNCSGRHNIKFGDMIIVWPDTDIEDATWNWTWNPPSDYTRPDVVFYEPKEKADYTTMSIELDTTENPQEIGAFVNDSCVGACSVLSEDTLVVMKAYLDGQPGDSVVFREHYASREINERGIKDYMVLNLDNMQKEKRAIVVGEGNPLIVVSFKKGSANEEKPFDIETSFNVYPNPASHEVNYSLRVDRETMLSISIYSINGRLVSKPVEQMVQPGLIDSALKLTDGSGNRLKPGIYVIMAEIGEITEVRKLIVE